MFRMAMTENERLEYLTHARICMRIAREYLGGNSPFTKEQVLEELEQGGFMLTYLILNQKHGGEA